MFFFYLLLCGAAHEGDCDLYLAPSTILGAGRGVFAGKDFIRGGAVDMAPTLPIHHFNFVSKMMLNRYVYGTNEEDYSMVVFGVANLFNHADDNADISVRHEWSSLDVVNAGYHRKRGYTDFTPVSHFFSKDVKAGQEIFTSYGDDWFGEVCNSYSITGKSKRCIHIEHAKSNNFSVSQNYLTEKGRCLSDVSIHRSLLPFAGNGLFARRFFPKGSIVTVSPVLALRRDLVEEASIPSESGGGSVLMNYCFVSKQSRIALFPVTAAAMINHQTAGIANVELRWYSWETGSFARTDSNLSDFFSFNMSLDSIMQSSYAPFDVAYVATRDISPLEEITLSYGKEWENMWLNYSYRVDDYLSRPYVAFPHFRSFLSAPEGLFPEEWESVVADSHVPVVKDEL